MLIHENAKCYSHFENNLAVSYHDKHTLNIHTHNFTLNIYQSPREMKTQIHTKSGFIVKNWKQTKYSSTGGWINKL